MRIIVSGPATRLDRFLLTRDPYAALGRRRLGLLLQSEVVRVNGRPARKGTLVRAGDEIAFDAAAPPPDATPLVPLIVRYEDAALVAIDKPPGLPSTIGRRPGPSVAAGLLVRYPEMAAIDTRATAGLVHRLDTGTSGLLLAARDPATHTRLREAFRRKAVTKDYLAVVHGRLERAQTVTKPLAHHRRSRGRMVPARSEVKAWPAHTEIVPLASDGRTSVVGLRMRTGVTHQLRVHLALLGHPIVGDPRYGRRDAGGTDEDGIPGWHYLHARAIHFDDADLPRGLVTPFPDHWRRFFLARHWNEPSA